MEPPKKRFQNVQPHYIQWGLTALCVIVASAVVILFLQSIPALMKKLGQLFDILSPFIYGFVMAYLLLPIFNTLYRWLFPKLKNKLKHPEKSTKALCSVVTLLIGLTIVGTLLGMVLPQLVTSVISLTESMEGYLNQIYRWIDVLLQDNLMMERSVFQLYTQFSTQVTGWIENIALPQLVQLMGGVVTTVGVLFDLFVGIIIALYILNSKDTFCAQAKKITYSVLPIKHANRLIHRMGWIHRVFGGFITGKLIDSLIMGVICFIGLQILMVLGLLTIMPSYALLISVIVGVTNIIPFFGPFIGAIPSAILILVISPIQALYFIIFILALQQFDGNILGPKILGSSTGLSSFWVMFAILVAGGMFGFVGMAIGVPVFAVLYTIASEGVNYLLKRRGMPTDTDLYRGRTTLDPNSKQILSEDEQAYQPFSVDTSQNALGAEPHSPEA